MRAEQFFEGYTNINQQRIDEEEEPELTESTDEDAKEDESAAKVARKKNPVPQDQREAIFLAISENNIYSLPKNPQKELSAHPKCKVEYVHSLCVVIYSLVKHKKWFDCKIYVAEELAGLVDACRRCQNGLSLLIKYGTFDDPHMYKVFITLFEGIKVLEELNDSIEAYLEIGRFFSSKAKPLYEAYAAELQAKHGVWLPDVDDEKGDDNNHKGEGKDAENQALAQRDKASVAAPDETLGKRASGDDGNKSKRKRTKE